MNRADARFIGDVRQVLRSAPLERLYYLAQTIHHELVARDLGARCEAAALELALLADVDVLRRSIYSSDCETEPHDWTHAGPPCPSCRPVYQPLPEQS